jgi:hypothetical protein
MCVSPEDLRRTGGYLERRTASFAARRALLGAAFGRRPIPVLVDPPLQHLARLVERARQFRRRLLARGVAEVTIRMRLRDALAPRDEHAPMIGRRRHAE